MHVCVVSGIAINIISNTEKRGRRRRHGVQPWHSRSHYLLILSGRLLVRPLVGTGRDGEGRREEKGRKKERLAENTRMYNH